MEISREEAFHRVADVLHCKWTLAVLDAIDRGLTRPSQIERSLDGLTTKVLTERLKKLERYGLVQRTAYAEIPPRVEYTFTVRGERVRDLVREIRGFVDDWTEPEEGAPG